MNINPWPIGIDSDPSLISGSAGSSTSTVAQVTHGLSAYSSDPEHTHAGSYAVDASSFSTDLSLSKTYQQGHIGHIDHESAQPRGAFAFPTPYGAASHAYHVLSIHHHHSKHASPPAIAPRHIQQGHGAVRRGRRSGGGEMDDFSLGPGTPTVPACCASTAAGSPACHASQSSHRGPSSPPAPAGTPSPSDCRRRAASPAATRASAAAGDEIREEGPGLQNLESEGALCLPAAACGGSAAAFDSGMLEWQVRHLASVEARLLRSKICEMVAPGASLQSKVTVCTAIFSVSILVGWS